MFLTKYAETFHMSEVKASVYVFFFINRNQFLIQVLVNLYLEIINLQILPQGRIENLFTRPTKGSRMDRAFHILTENLTFYPCHVSQPSAPLLSSF